MNLNSLIEEITNEVIKVLEEKGLSPQPPSLSSLPKILFPLTYGMVTWKENIGKIRNLSGNGIFTPLFIADIMEKEIIDKEFSGMCHFYSFHDMDKINLFSNVQLIAVPIFTLYNLARISSLTPFSFVERLILDGLQKGISVIIARDEFCPLNELRKSAGMDKGTPFYNDAVNTYGEKLSSWGIKFINLSNMNSVIEKEIKKEEKVIIRKNKSSREVITKDDVIAFSSSGNKTMEISAGAIITHMALDVAKERGISIVKSEK